MATLAELTTERDAVFTAMGALRGGALSTSINGRTIQHHQLGELREQYEWLTRQISVATTSRRSAVVSFRKPT